MELEFSAEYIQNPVAADEANYNDISIGQIIESGQLGIRTEGGWLKV